MRRNRHGGGNSSTGATTGNALMRIREEELYREAGFDGFVAYLESKAWGVSLWRAYQMIEAAAVVSVSGLQHVANDRQASELAPLMKKATPEVVRRRDRRPLWTPGSSGGSSRGKGVPSLEGMRGGAHYEYPELDSEHKQEEQAPVTRRVGAGGMAATIELHRRPDACTAV